MTLSVTPSTDAEAMAAALIGPGVSLVPGSAVYQGAPNASGFFSGDTSIFGNAAGVSGVILTTGSVANALPPNNAEDTTQSNEFAGSGYLDSLVPGITTFDASTLTFRITLNPTVAGLQWDYVFGSEEYLQFVGSEFNDIFALSISSDGINFTNLALVPSTSLPVSINNVNPGSNSQYYRDNPVGSNNYPIQYNGLTTVLTSTATNLTPGAEYTLRFAIADVADYSYDSGVFLLGGSIRGPLGPIGPWYPDFCYTTKPSTSTKFGLYSHCPNGMAFRVNPRVRPTIRITTRSKNNGEDFEVDCEDEPQPLADLWKSRYHFSMRSGIVETSRDIGGDVGFLYSGDEFTYRLDHRSDARTKIVFDSSNTDNTEDAANGEANCSDVASAVSARQKAADDGLIVGELYKVGSALAILIERIPGDGVFESESDNEPVGGGRTIDCKFRVVRDGQVGVITDMDYFDPDWSGTTQRPTQWMRVNSIAELEPPDTYYSCSAFPQLFRCAIASFTLTRAAQVIAIGFASNVGIRVSGFCNLRDCPSLQNINRRAGLAYNNNTYDKNKKLGATNFFAGTIQRPETRISLFRIRYRSGNGSWQTFGATFGFIGTAGAAVLNQLRIEMPEARRWEIQMEPVTSWELRNDTQLSLPICIIDSKSTIRNRTDVDNGVTVEWYGETRPRNRKDFNITSLEPKEDVGLPTTDDHSIYDDWAMVAETFPYNEIQTSLESSPEHEIVYVNTYTINPAAPSYDRLATVGLNIYASTEFNRLAQFSAYISDGLETRLLLGLDQPGSTNLFPDILRAYLTDKRYGRGQVIGDKLVDVESFREAANWCQLRRYFYDAVDATRVNLLQWAANTAAFHLLELNQRGGKWALEPAIIFPEDGPVPVRALFTAGNIVKGTFRLQYLPDTERQPIRVSAKWREERQRSDLTSSGFFPVERTVFVREASQSDSDPIEAIDLSAFCTNPEHAIDVCCYLIRQRRLIDHTIAFSTTPEGIGTGLAAGHYIKVAMDLSYFDQFANGVILQDGTIISTQSDLLTPGEFEAAVWDGASDFIYDANIVVGEDGKAAPSGVIFAKKSTTGETRIYKIEKISTNDQDGTVEIEAVYHPCDSNGISELGKNWTTYQTDGYWIIEGNED